MAEIDMTVTILETLGILTLSSSAEIRTAAPIEKTGSIGIKKKVLTKPNSEKKTIMGISQSPGK
jgi:hypothetical protein